MQIDLIDDLDQLSALRGNWSAMPLPSPMSSPAWLIPWWRHVGATASNAACPNQLFCVAVRDQAGRLAGLAPWYRTIGRGGQCIVRSLGDGRVASDHQRILCPDELVDPVVDAMVDWLLGQARDDWDAFDLDGIDADDPVMLRFAERMASRGGCLVQPRPATASWVIALPASWDEMLARLSKSHRRRARRLQREYIDSGRARCHLLARDDQISDYFDQLVRLHRARRQTLGDEGVFDHPAIHAFHETAIGELLADDQLQLMLLELDGRPVAAEYVLKSGDTCFAYQSGFDVTASQHSPGNLAQTQLIRQAIDAGLRCYDFLRGDEPYKANWGAVARPAIRLRIRGRAVRGYLGHLSDSVRLRAKRLLSKWSVRRPAGQSSRGPRHCSAERAGSTAVPRCQAG